MGFMDKIFKPNQETKQESTEVPWHNLTDVSQLDAIEQESKTETVAIFKHSTRCGISNMVLKNFRREYDPEATKDVKLYFLDLLSHREISNEIATKFNVQHESPQMIVLKDGKVVYHASHQAISAQKLAEM